MQTLLGSKEVAVRGEEVYASEIKMVVEDQHEGKFLILDVTSHDYEIDWDDMAAQERLEQRQPHGVFYGLRVGSPATYFIGKDIL
jgi:hypothetical protein